MYNIKPFDHELYARVIGMTQKIAKEKGIRISKIEGFDLPMDTKSNVAGVAALAFLEHAKPDCGFEIEETEGAINPSLLCER